MNKMIYCKCIVVLVLSALNFHGFAQQISLADSSALYGDQQAEKQTAVKRRKNTISVNVTNPSVISPRFITFGYERLLNNNQSVMVQTGRFSIPRFLETLSDSLGIETDYKDRGFHLSADYRFYLKKENKYKAPRGIYLGSYCAYNSLTRNVDWYLDGNNLNTLVNSDFKLNILAIGAEIGYQFVFWDRMSVDLILAGPGIGFYDLKTKLNTTLTPAEESEFFDKLNEYLENNLPGYNGIIDAGEFKRKGSFDTFEIAFRYSVRVGYRF